MLVRASDGKVSRGEEVFVNYGPAKIDSQFALDFGFADAVCSRPGYALGPIGIPEDDVNRIDKEDILEVAGFSRAPSFILRAFEDPPFDLRVFARLLNVKRQDAFLLEAIFRREAWGLMREPVSRMNEQEACSTMITGCEEALAAYPTRVEEDRVVAEDVAAPPRARLAARVVMGEKQALMETLSFFAGRAQRLDQMEYYQERRLRSLNLLDRDGNSTYDPFEDPMA
jgi:[ribulose-bisphosphate carboxylase]-lysine N-methyltransferase